MRVHIITDSASDLSQETAAQWGITVMPLAIRFGDTEYRDGVTLSNTEFYEKLAAEKQPPKTSQITPYEYEQAFRQHLDKGEEVVCLCISSGVSGSYQSACTAASMFDEGVYVVDSQQFCVSEAIQAQYAVRLRDEGKSAREIAETLEATKGRAHVIAVFDTLEYLKKGGRISATAAFVGGALSIKPVLTIEEGVVKILGKARGSHRANNMLTEFVEKYGPIDFDMPYYLAYSGASDELLRTYVRDSSRLYEDLPGGLPEHPPVASVGATIGTYAGPGAIALAFYSKV